MAAFAVLAFVVALLAASGSSAMSIAGLLAHIEGIHNAALSANPDIMLDLSFLFGWQMAGAALSQHQASAACEDISSIGHGKWAAIGLDPIAIRDPTDAIVFIIHYSTSIFATQVLSAFNDTASFAYLCNNIKYDLLDDLMLNDTAVLGPVCHSGGVHAPPRPFGPGHGVDGNQAAALSVKQTMSVLYAYILATAATTSSQLKTLCSDAWEYVNSLDQELMNGTAFQTALCEIREPISAEEAVDVIVVLMTRMFITTLENLNNVGGWFDWLCNHVDAEGMDTVGLFGDAVRQTICQDSLAIKSS